MHEPDGDHVIVAWEDTRDNGYDAALVYMLDLTADTLYQSAAWEITGAPTAGAAIDPTPVWARGQRQPDVGSGGIVWLDERYSLWSDERQPDQHRRLALRPEHRVAVKRCALA